MALDGLFLHCLKKEIEDIALDSRVEKIHQPTREELVVHLRGRNGANKLLLSAKADGARVHFTEYAPENPAVPPMFCMLMRKRLTGARLVGVRQNDVERALFFDFDGTNELGDKTRYTLIIEIMSRYSNIILIDGDDMIIDSIKRVDFTKSSVREILPNIKYELPPKQDKLNLLEDDLNEISFKIIDSNKRLSKSIQNVVQGISPIICREISYRVYGDDIIAACAEIEKIKSQLDLIKQCAIKDNPNGYIVYDIDNKPKDFTFVNITQYDNLVEVKSFESFSKLLDSYYFERERVDRIHQRSQSLFKNLNVLLERANRTTIARTEQLKECEQKEKYKKYGDLINSNLFALEKGALYYDLLDYFDESMSMIRIPADPSLTPNQNAQKYYKEYRKLQTAESMLSDLIEKSKQEADYLYSVIDSLSRADTERELTAIKEELYDGGYIKNRTRNRVKKQKALPPMEFSSSDGFKILVGRNNVQNDKLTLKIAKNYDMWLHTKDVHGTHVIIISDNKEISDTAIYEGAILAAYHSRASSSSKVAVDYTIVKNVRKPNGAKPGMVIYDNNKTIYVTPNFEYVEKLNVGE